MNAKAKGSRNERRSRDLLEAVGYSATRAAGSLGCWDLLGVGSQGVVLMQVKSNRAPSSAEMETLPNFACPENCRRLVHVWKDRARMPIVKEIV